MKTVRNEADRSALVERINKLDGSAKPSWGKMNVNQMVSHLVQSGDMPFENITADKSNFVSRNVIKYIILYVLQLPKDVPTAPEFNQQENGRKPQELSVDKQFLIESLKKIANLPENFDCESHPFFWKDECQRMGDYCLQTHRPSSKTVWFLNFCYFARHGNSETLVRRTGFCGCSLSTGILEMASTTSMPAVTRPNAANFPSRCPPIPTKIKKLELALFGSSPRAIEIIPRTCLILFGSSGMLRFIRFEIASAYFGRVLELPPWITKSGTTRENVVVSNAPRAVKLRKFLTVSGADSGNISSSILPDSVSIRTHC